MKNANWLDLASLLTLIVTVTLFGLALIFHGFTRDLLLEAGVFLVSVKLVISNYKIENYARSLKEKLDAIEKKLN
jgi:hypothetical protein